jgi:tRNA-uridine 2-sulfurtransferase
MKKKVVFVGLSGGVDSAVSAALLQRTGYDVVGVFMRTWHPDFLECNEEEERHDAMRIAAHLDIPFLTFDLEKVYKKEVADYMISEYRRGRTPNPDVMCNKKVKFGTFLEKALAMGAGHVATGHYAQNINNNLVRGIDPAKDQSYFLWTLTQKQLKNIIFPVGHLKKSEVRELAKKFKLPVSEKKDSQGICFLGEVDLKKFLKHYIKEKKGKVVNERGVVIGHHEGVTFYTLGERRGFTITKKTPKDKPYYVVDKNSKRNILIVSQNKNSDISLSKNVYKIKKTNWINQTPKSGQIYTTQVRYHGEFWPCTVESSRVIFNKPVLATPGQSLVLYDGDVCLGGGVII